jgi:hypothetical protein
METVKTSDLGSNASKISFAALQNGESVQVVRPDGSVFASIGPNPTMLLQETVGEDFQDDDLDLVTDTSWYREPIERD